jgi:hypothetical protein
VVATGPLALPGLTRHDLRATLAALAGETPEGRSDEARPERPAGAAGGTPPGAPIEAPRGAVERLLAAAGRRL